MHDTELETLALKAFPAATQIIILAAGNPGGMLFHDADAVLQAAGIAATSWNPATGVLYLRRLPTEHMSQRDPNAPKRSV
jgi:hypothetical protein